MVTENDVIEKLLWGLWRSIDDSFKERYFHEIWEHFENAIKSSSYTNSLKKFLDNIKQRIPMTVQPKYQENILSIIDSGEDERVLNWLRNETTYLIMSCRVMNQERLAEIKSNKQA